MKKIYDIVVKTGTYEKGGETKNRYQNVGAVIQGDEGPFMLLERTFNPAGAPNPDGRETVLLSLFKPRERQEAPAQQESQGGGFDDDIPF